MKKLISLFIYINFKTVVLKIEIRPFAIVFYLIRKNVI